MDKRLLITFGIAAAMAACSGQPASTPAAGHVVGLGGRLTVNPVGFKLVLTSPKPGLATAAGGGESVVAGTLAVTAASVNISELRLDRPEGADCGEIEHHGEEGDHGDSMHHGEGVTGTSDMHGDRGSPHAAPASAGPGATAAAGPMPGACAMDGDGEKIVFTGPFMVNLLTGASTPSLSDLTIPPGSYRRIRLRIAKLDGDVPPRPLHGLSILAYGTYTTATTTPVEIALHFDRNIEFKAPETAPIVIGVAGGADIAVRISSAAWFTNVNTGIAACLAEHPSVAAGGVIRINTRSGGEHCSAVEEALEDNFEHAGSLDREDEGDHGEESHHDATSPTSEHGH